MLIEDEIRAPTMTSNGVAPAPSESSAFINHLHSLPVVHDGVTYFKSHPIGQKSIAASSSAYDIFVKPFSPYIAKANGYASPYVSKADKYADSGLGHVEQRFPIVKEPTDKLKGRLHDTVQYPRKKASDIFTLGSGYILDQKDYVTKVYTSEYNKAGGEGIVAAAKASVTTTLGISTQFVGWLSTFLVTKKEEAEKKVDEKTNSH